jgi:small subunit ribosomal protein S16
MAVVIRLARFGTKHAPKYRITVADSRKYVTGKFLEVIGTYVPTPQGKDQKVVMDLAKAEAWIAKGAQPSDRVKHVMKLAQASK